MGKFPRILSLFLVCFLSTFKGFAQTVDNLDAGALVEADSRGLEDELPKDLGGHVKDIFMKGSADGKSVFTVLGISKAAKLSNKILNRMVHLQELVDIGDRFNNPEHINDFSDEYHRGVEAMKEAAPQILKAPWRSVKKIPFSHKVTIQQARDAYASSNSTGEGVVKYTGLVAWAYVKDAYYLVIETPFEFVKNLAVATVGVPFRLAFQVLEIGLRFTWFAVKATIGLIASGFVMAYSVVTSAVASALSFIIEGPRYIWRPLQMGEDLNVKPDKFAEVGVLLQQVLATNVSKDKEIKIEAQIEEEKEKYKVYVIKENKEKQLAYVAKLKIRDESVFLDLEMARSYFEDLKDELEAQGMAKPDRKDQIKLDMRHLVDILKSKLTADMMRLEDLEGGSWLKRLQIEEDLKVPSDKYILAGSIMAQVLETGLGDEREVVVESKLKIKDGKKGDDNSVEHPERYKGENFEVYVGSGDDRKFAYDVKLTPIKKGLHVDIEMVRGYYKHLRRKFRMKGLVEAGIQEHISMELRHIEELYRYELGKALAN